MPAGMHKAGVGGSVIESVFLRNRQSVHVSTQSDGRFGPASAGQMRQNPGSLREPRAEFDSRLRKFPLHHTGRAMFLKTDLRMAVQIVAQVYKRREFPGNEFIHFFLSGHGSRHWDGWKERSVCGTEWLPWSRL